jgi:hypothetical protein
MHRNISGSLEVVQVPPDHGGPTISRLIQSPTGSHGFFRLHSHHAGVRIGDVLANVVPVRGDGEPFRVCGNRNA